ncbi:MAG: MOSC domain-containing protein [Acidimicrobiia bacterium]|nr:MOSC domain-containing protein [Acidimicrobiia bacterium]
MEPFTDVDLAALEAGLGHIRESPSDDGELVMIVRRPEIGAREILDEGELSLTEGLVGDVWPRRRSRRTPDGSPHPDMQLNVINARFSALISQDADHRAQAGDQLHVDLDLSVDDLPAGTRLAIGTAVIEVTDQPHTGCGKFSRRFGAAVHRFANGEVGSALRLRGLNAKVVQPGTIRTGDRIKRLS